MNEGKFALAKQLWLTKVAVIKKSSTYFDNKSKIIDTFGSEELFGLASIQKLCFLP
jgi:hypothetical protein